MINLFQTKFQTTHNSTFSSKEKLTFPARICWSMWSSGVSAMAVELSHNLCFFNVPSADLSYQSCYSAAARRFIADNMQLTASNLPNLLPNARQTKMESNGPLQPIANLWTGDNMHLSRTKSDQDLCMATCSSPNN